MYDNAELNELRNAYLEVIAVNTRCVVCPTSICLRVSEPTASIFVTNFVCESYWGGKMIENSFNFLLNESISNLLLFVSNVRISGHDTFAISPASTSGIQLQPSKCASQQVPKLRKLYKLDLFALNYLKGYLLLYLAHTVSSIYSYNLHTPVSACENNRIVGRW